MNPELVFEFKAKTDDFEKGAKKVEATGAGIDSSLKKVNATGKTFSDIYEKAAAIAGGTFVTAALALATSVSNANEQVELLNRSVQISSGSQQAYASNMASLNAIADSQKKSIFELAGSFNELARETRGTANEGQPAAQVFDTLVSVSKKLETTVADTTGTFTSFIDRMKQGTVDSNGLTNELDKRLYEAFTKVAEGMGVTNEELNKVLKTSDEAVATILPQLAAELKNSLGDIPQSNAKDLGDNIEYAKSKLTLLLDGLFSTSGVKSALAQGAEDAANFLSVLDKINREHGASTAVGALMTKGLVSAADTFIPGVNLQFDPFGYQGQAAMNKTREAFGEATPYGKKGGSSSQYKLPSELTKTDFDIASKIYEDRIAEQEKANQKLLAEEKRLAAERKRVLDEITSKEIEESKQRIKDGIKAVNDEVEKKYSKATDNVGVGMIGNTGTVRKYDYQKDQFHTEFTNPVGGATDGLEKMKAIIEQLQSLDPIYWQKLLNAEDLKKEQKSLAQTAEELNKSVNQQLGAAFSQAGRQIPEAIGGMVAAVAQGGEGMQDVGNTFFRIAADLFEQVGQALLTATGLFTAAKASIDSMNPAVAAAGAVLAFAAAALLRNQIQTAGQEASGRFFSGGIATGPIGVDNIPIDVSAGEMILNSRQQRNMFGLLNGSGLGRSMASGNSSRFSDNGGSQQNKLVAVVQGDKLAVMIKKGDKKNRKFS